MTDHEAGYLQALKDVQNAVRQMVNDLGSSPEGKVEMLGVVSFLEGMIRTNGGEGNSEAESPSDAIDGDYWTR